MYDHDEIGVHHVQSGFGHGLHHVQPGLGHGLGVPPRPPRTRTRARRPCLRLRSTKWRTHGTAGSTASAESGPIGVGHRGGDWSLSRRTTSRARHRPQRSRTRHRRPRPQRSRTRHRRPRPQRTRHSAPVETISPDVVDLGGGDLGDGEDRGPDARQWRLVGQHQGPTSRPHTAGGGLRDQRSETTSVLGSSGSLQARGRVPVFSTRHAPHAPVDVSSEPPRALSWMGSVGRAARI